MSEFFTLHHVSTNVFHFHAIFFESITEEGGSPGLVPSSGSLCIGEGALLHGDFEDFKRSSGPKR